MEPKDGEKSWWIVLDSLLLRTYGVEKFTLKLKSKNS